MNTKQDILQNITTLSRFEPLSPRKIYYLNFLTTYNVMTDLFKLVSGKSEFVIETKYDDVSGCPQLIQILFAHKFKLHIILVETLYLPTTDLYLHNQIVSLFSIILSPSNEIRSWKDLKTDLKFFLDCHIFSCNQIDKMHVINMQDKFQTWLRKNFANIELNCIPSINWTLEIAIAFLFHKYFDTSLSKSLDWNIGLFVRFDTNCNKKNFPNNSPSFSLLEDNECRTILCEYSVDECIAVTKIAAFLQNDWARKRGTNYLKSFYNNFRSFENY